MTVSVFTSLIPHRLRLSSRFEQLMVTDDKPSLRCRTAGDSYCCGSFASVAKKLSCMLQHNMDNVNLTMGLQTTAGPLCVWGRKRRLFLVCHFQLKQRNKYVKKEKAIWVTIQQDFLCFIYAVKRDSVSATCWDADARREVSAAGSWGGAVTK